MWLLRSYSKTIVSLENYTCKSFIKLTPGENEKCARGEICPGLGEYTQMSGCTPCKVANSTKMANLAEICHEFGEYMTIDDKRGPLVRANLTKMTNLGKSYHYKLSAKN